MAHPGPSQPPPGVPRLLWPPQGAAVEHFEIVERWETNTAPSYAAADGRAVEARHLSALYWLLDEYTRETTAPSDTDCVEIVLSVARTEMAGGRVGFAYALDGGALGLPGADRARGVLWRYLHGRLGRQLPA